jgi:4-carboxymuconolactone decarboxylase
MRSSALCCACAVPGRSPNNNYRAAAQDHRTEDDIVTAEVKENGVQIRRDMFGAEFTDRQIEQANAFTRPMQDVVSQYCFGETWSRPGLTRRERSMVTLAALCAMGRSHELRVHVVGALANGVTPLEIRELLLHTMVYAGVPLGADAIRNAGEVLAERNIDLDTL